MRLEQDRFGRLKMYIHMLAGALVMLALLLSLAALAQKGSGEGSIGWYFGVCFLTIPILVYQTMVPAWSRAHKFANVYAFAGLDIGSVILWFSAWVVIASYVISGKGKGSNTKESGCDNFKYGNAAKCRLSEASVIFGVVIMLTFGVTAFFSFKGVMEYKRTGIAPGPAGFAQAKGLPSSSFRSKSGGLGGVKSTNPSADVEEEDSAFDAHMNLRNDMEDDGYDQQGREYGGYSNGSYRYDHPSDYPEHGGQGDYDYAGAGHRGDFGVPKTFQA